MPSSGRSWLKSANLIDEGRSEPSVPTMWPKTRAATAVLDRTGMGPSSTSNVNLQAGERLAALINELDDSCG